MKRYKVFLDVSNNTSHIGSDVRGVGVENVMEWIHSDTLFSAIVHGWSRCYGFEKDKSGTEHLFEKFNNYSETHDETILPFRISSAFLACKHKPSENKPSELIEFVPKPLALLDELKEMDGITKIKFISMTNLLKWLKIDKNDQTKADFQRSIADDNEIYKKLFLQRIRAVNSKDRIRNQTQVFHRGETIYRENTYLYFYADVHKDFDDAFKTSLNYIKEFAGVGGEINIGFSEINDIKIEPFKSDLFNITNGGSKKYLLSLIALCDTINYDNSFYDIVNKKSWFHSPFNPIQLRKNTVKMITEGSCVDCKNVSGELLDVTPEMWLNYKKDTENYPQWHPIYRNGLGYWIEY